MPCCKVKGGLEGHAQNYALSRRGREFGENFPFAACPCDSFRVGKSRREEQRKLTATAEQVPACQLRTHGCSVGLPSSAQYVTIVSVTVCKYYYTVNVDHIMRGLTELALDGHIIAEYDQLNCVSL